MAFSYTLGTHTVADCPEIPGSQVTEFDNDDRGGGVLPSMRAGSGAKYRFRTTLGVVGSVERLVLANIMAMICSLDNWTVNGIGPGPLQITVEGDAVQVAEITIG